MAIMKLFYTLLAYLAVVGLCESSMVRYDDFKVYKVSIENEQQLKSFKELGNQLPVHYLNDIAGAGRQYDIVIDPANEAALESEFKYQEISYEQVIDNLQNVIEESMVGMEDAPEENNRFMKNPMTWTAYHKLNDINGWMNYWLIRRMDIVKPVFVGVSYEGRLIRGIKISAKPGNKAIMIEANIHAIEWISSAVGTCFFENLLKGDDPKMKELLMKYDWIFVPVLNPDGFVYSHDVARLWRKNRKPTGFSNSSGICYGVDMNRNFDFHWGGAGYNVDVPCDHWYGGSAAATEPEVIAQQKFVYAMSKKNDIRMYLALHSYGQFVLLPYGHSTTDFPSNYDQMLRIATAFTDAADPVNKTWKAGASGLLNYVVSGASKDWAYGVCGIPFTATIELPDQGETGFLLPASRILETCTTVTNAMMAMLEKAEEENLFE